MTELNLFSTPNEKVETPHHVQVKKPEQTPELTTPPVVEDHPPVQIVNLEIPMAQPAVDISGQNIDEAIETVDDVIEMAEEVLPESLRPHISWFKRKWMWAKRNYKKYRVWWHKLGKLELDPKIRADFRAQRQQTSVLFKRINSALGELEEHKHRFEVAEELATKAQEALEELKTKTSMMR